MTALKRVGRWWVVVGLFVALPGQGFAKKASAQQAYEGARKAYFSLKDNKSKQAYRHNWLKVIARFKRVHAVHRDTGYGARALYTEAELWSDLSLISRLRSDLSSALFSYESVWLEYPQSSLADDALFQRATIYLNRLEKRKEAAWAVRDILRLYPKGDMASRAKQWVAGFSDVPKRPTQNEKLAGSGSTRTGRQREDGGTSVVTQIKHWSNRSYSRVAVYLDGPAEVRTGQVAQNKRAGRPSRIFLDIHKATKSKKVKASTPVNDKLLSQIRTAQHKGDVVRVVLDLKGDVGQHRVLVMDNPYRVMVDAYREGSQKAGGPIVAPKPKKFRVVLDPGHGGKDNGASGYRTLREKDVVLGIAKRLKEKLEKENVEVILTRTKDEFVSLEERTAIANRSDADAFVSIHTNSHQDSTMNGVETYYLDTTDDQYSIRLAALENKTKEDRVSDVQLALTDLASKAFTDASIRLAKAVQGTLHNQVRAFNSESRNLGVKPSLFYVLLGARMPAILVETSFISNSKEGKLLRTPKYQGHIADAISRALIRYLGKSRDS